LTLKLSYPAAMRAKGYTNVESNDPSEAEDWRFSLFSFVFFPLSVVVPPFPWGASEYNNIIAVVVERNHYKNGTGGGTWTWTGASQTDILWGI
jgi:hypothetical protein